LLYAAVILASAFLSFEIQPLVGKMVTAGFGGSAAIWGVCLLFFQSVLLFGYSLTYALASMAPRRQSIAYLLIVLTSAACLNLPGPAGWSADTQGEVAQTLLFVLAQHLAFPCLILSSISGMMQTWFNLSRLGNPYPLYSLSNVGSLGALLAYPLLIEPALSLTHTIACWKASYFFLVLLVCVAACDLFRHNPSAEADCPSSKETPPPEPPPEPQLDLGSPLESVPAPEPQLDLKPPQERVPAPEPKPLAQPEAEPGPRDFAWWITLSAMGTLALVSYTAYLTQDIAPVPLIYVIPLCLYLTSFIITFAGDRFYKRAVFIYLTPLLWLVEAGISAFWVERTVLTLAMLWSLVAVLAFMFCFFLTCQGELYRSKPAAKHLASFYLAIAFGGMLGGVFVNFVAPAIFNTYMERYIVGVFIVLLWIMVAAASYNRRKIAIFANCIYGALLGSSLIFVMAASKESSKVIYQKRNFFGCISVSSGGDSVALRNGRIMHGRQFTGDADRRREPTLYYREGSGLDMIDFYLRQTNKGPVKYGLIGLGAGTIAAYGRPGDSFVFYEIDPKVIACAHKYFSFLSDSQAQVTVLPGDARAQMKRQVPQHYNLLVIDDFNGDAVPVHLLTREAMNIYFSHLVQDGIVLVHVTNRFIDLEPVLGNLASSLDLKACTLASDCGTYVALCRSTNFKPSVPQDDQSKERFKGLNILPVRRVAAIGVWTDDYSNLFGTILSKWQRR